MSDEYANPGDTIVSKNTTAQKGKRMLVIERPIGQVGTDDEPGCAWFIAFGGQPYFLRPDKYTIVERAEKVHRMVGVNAELDVDASLKKQRDNNLRHAFGF